MMTMIGDLEPIIGFIFPLGIILPIIHIGTLGTMITTGMIMDTGVILIMVPVTIPIAIGDTHIIEIITITHGIIPGHTTRIITEIRIIEPISQE